MKSKLAEKSRADLVEAHKRMTKAERLQAFVNHSTELAKIFHAGKKSREQKRNKILQK